MYDIRMLISITYDTDTQHSDHIEISSDLGGMYICIYVPLNSGLP